MHGHCEWCEQRARLTRIISLSPTFLPFEWVCSACLELAAFERLWVRSDLRNTFSADLLLSDLAA